MIKFSRTVINPPHGAGYTIRVLDTSYYFTEDKSRKEHKQIFSVGQTWYHADESAYKIEDILLMVPKNARTGHKFYALLKCVNRPQNLRVELNTLLKFWKPELSSNEGLNVSNNRFEKIE